MEQLLASLAAAIAPVLDTLRSPAVGGTIVVLTGLLFADFITATTAARRRGEYDPELLTMFVQTHVVGLWVPIVGLVLLATFTLPLVPVAGLAVVTYTAQTLASIRRNLDLPEQVGA